MDSELKLKMVGGVPNGIDEMDCSSFFDQMEDLLDFPADDMDAGLSGNLDSFPSFWAAHSESLPVSDSVFSNNTASDLSAELSVPYEDIVQLEWLSTFVEDSFSGGGSLTMEKPDGGVTTKDPFHTPSPVSVLESSTTSYCSADKPTPRCPDPSSIGKRGRARSKRPRPSTFNPRPTMQLLSPSVTSFPPQGSPKSASSDSENYAESRPVMFKIAKKHLPTTGEEKKKKKKIKLTLTPAPAEVISEHPSPSVRKCLHCEITKTPQWRAGPLGPKTLCNACGVRYKSGRLFPEYRPAASPTFIPSVHSNSHKKVVEMRTKVCDSPVEAQKSTMPELISKTSLPLDSM